MRLPWLLLAGCAATSRPEIASHDPRGVVTVDPDILASVGFLPASLRSLHCSPRGRQVVNRELLRGCAQADVDARCSIDGRYELVIGHFDVALVGDCLERLRSDGLGYRLDPGGRWLLFAYRTDTDNQKDLAPYVDAHPTLAEDPAGRDRLHYLHGVDFDLQTEGQPGAVDVLAPTLSQIIAGDTTVYELVDARAAARAGAWLEQGARWRRGVLITVTVEGHFVRVDAPPGDHWPASPAPSPDAPADGQLDPGVASLVAGVPVTTTGISCAPTQQLGPDATECASVLAAARAHCTLRGPHDQPLAMAVGPFDPAEARRCAAAIGKPAEGSAAFVVWSDDAQAVAWFSAGGDDLTSSPRSRRVLARVHGDTWAASFVDSTGAMLGVPSVSVSRDATHRVVEFASPADASRALEALRRRDAFISEPRRLPTPIQKGVFVEWTFP